MSWSVLPEGFEEAEKEKALEEAGTTVSFDLEKLASGVEEYVKQLSCAFVSKEDRETDPIMKLMTEFLKDIIPSWAKLMAKSSEERKECDAGDAIIAMTRSFATLMA